MSMFKYHGLLKVDYGLIETPWMINHSVVGKTSSTDNRVHVYMNMVVTRLLIIFLSIYFV